MELDSKLPVTFVPAHMTQLFHYSLFYYISFLYINLDVMSVKSWIHSWVTTD